jgi:hypothetical protein
MINNNPPAPARCGFVPDYPGYAGCTREKGHSGPCAHPYEAPEGACNCWLGHGGYGGDSYVREHCPVHGDHMAAGRATMFLPGVYRITPLGEHTAFECRVQPLDEGGYVLIDLNTNESLEVTQELLSKMRPQFLR